MKTRKILVLAFILAAFKGNAQDATNASGGNALGTTGTVSYTVGQVVYTTVTGANGSIAQGVQQAFEIQPILGIDNFNINLQLAVYPNPTTNWLQLEVKNIDFSTLRYQLFDINGRLLLNERIAAAISTIQMERLPASLFVLKVIDNNREVKTFKIIKK